MFKLLCPKTLNRARTVVVPCSHYSDKPKASENKLSAADPKEYVKSLAKRVSRPTEVEKDDLKWRTPWHEKNVQYYDTLRTFYSSKSHTTFLKFIQQPIDFSPSKIKSWWLNKREDYEEIVQRYIPERHNILGPELAAAHFIVHRGGAVKFHNDDKWIKADEHGNYILPDKYKSGMYLQAIDCTNIKLRYEGLANLRNLKNLEWLSLNNCQLLDDFAMDVIAHIFAHSLIYLDLRDCIKITDRGLGALYKMPHLKILYLDDFLKDTKYEMTCLLLEELNSDLLIKSDVVSFEIPDHYK